jgi:RNA polymerase sigma factor (TIGR02999 family)
MKPSPNEVTSLLLAWSNGDRAALDKLIPLVHDELHRLAHHYMRQERAGHTLQTTALANEAYVRLIDQRSVRWEGRAHFLAIAAQLMRRILVDYARSRCYAKRGGEARQVSFDESAIVSPQRGSELVAVDDALTELAARDSRKSQIVELRFFGGLNIEETAEVLGISPTTVQREWRSAKAWLYRAISPGTVNEG